MTEGFSKVEEVAFVPLDDLMDIEGFDEDVARELQARAQTYLETRDAEFEARRKELGVADDLGEIEGVTNEMLVALGENGVKDRDDLADLVGDELRFIMLADKGDNTLDSIASLDEGALRTVLAPSPLTGEEANRIIMAARAHWFDGEEAPEGETVPDAPDAPQAS